MPIILNLPEADKTDVICVEACLQSVSRFCAEMKIHVVIFSVVRNTVFLVK